MNTNSPSPASTPSVPSPSASPTALGENPADIKVPLSPVHKHRRGIVLTVLGLAWFALALFSAASPPGTGTFWRLVAGTALFALVVAWLAIGAWSLFLRRPMGILGWAGVPVIIVLAFALPWSNWFLSSRVRSHETELQSLAVQHSVSSDRKGRDINASAAGMTFVHATYLGNSVALAFDHDDGRAESGLMYTPGGTHADAPGWAKRSSLTRINGDWARYEWRGE